MTTNQARVDRAAARADNLEEMRAGAGANEDEDRVQDTEFPEPPPAAKKTPERQSARMQAKGRDPNVPTDPDVLAQYEQWQKLTSGKMELDTSDKVSPARIFVF